jgi:hypothetical protein
MNVTFTWLVQAIPVSLQEFVSFGSQYFGTQNQHSSAENSLSLHVSLTCTECSFCKRLNCRSTRRMVIMNMVKVKERTLSK